MISWSRNRRQRGSFSQFWGQQTIIVIILSTEQSSRHWYQSQGAYLLCDQTAWDQPFRKQSTNILQNWECVRLLPKAVILPGQAPISRTSRELFGPEKLVVKLKSTRFEKMIFLHAFNMRKIKRIAKFEGLEPRRCKDIKGIVVPDIGPKSFGTFEKQAREAILNSTERKATNCLLAHVAPVVQKVDSTIHWINDYPPVLSNLWTTEAWPLMPRNATI